jgi:oligoendopeptidase F
MLAKNYVSLYVESLPEETQEIANSLFSSQNSMFVDSENALEGAFTAFLYEYENPFCYFGPGYQDSMTVVHEMGHYYASCYAPADLIPLDLAETHSQGNEWLFFTYAQQHVPADMYKALTQWYLYMATVNIIVCTMVDEYEEYVITHADTLTPTALDGVMEQLYNEYGGVNFVEGYFGDMKEYWKIAVVETSAYFISYATSGMAALSLYTVAQEDYDAAWEIYRKLAEELDLEKGFLKHLKDAGLADPFQKESYTALESLFS